MNAAKLRRHAPPYDWERIHADVQSTGAAIVRELFSANEVDELNAQVDGYVLAHPGAGLPDTGSEAYDRFLGGQTIRLQGLLDKLPAVADWLGNERLLAWAERSMAPLASSVLLSAGELIQIGSGEPRQFLHRDSDSWPATVTASDPYVVNAIVALSKFTEHNGATWLVPGSWQWPRERRAVPGEFLQALMRPGDAVLFRGDVLHAGGANETEAPRRALSISYCAGWLRPVENSLLNVSRERVRELPDHLQGLLGYRAYDGSAQAGGMLGLYENGDPGAVL